MRVTGTWSRAEATAFLETTRVPIRIACRTPGGALWMVSLWYRSVNGSLQCATSSRADVVTYLEASPHVAFEVSTNRPPYRGVRGNGTAELRPDADKALLRSLLERYLGGTESRLAESLLDADREETAIEIEPARLYTWDFSDRMADVEPVPADQDG